LGIIFNNVRPKEEHYYSSEYYGSKNTTAHPLGRFQQSTEEPAVLPAIEVRPSAVAPPVPEPVPVIVGREEQSEGVHMTLHTVTLGRHIGAQPAAAGMVFLLVDVDIANYGAFGHLFDPAQTALTRREGTDYGRALASFIPIHGANDDTDL